MTAPTCISYIRFSSDRQSQGSSLERQLQASRAYAEKHGYVFDERFNYRDLGVSAYTGDHAKFGDLHRFLTAIKSGDIPKGTILLVESLDRLSRESVLEAFKQFQAILDEDIKVVTLCDEMEYTKENLATDFTKLIVSLSVMMRANEESKIKSQRIRGGFEKKRKNLANVKMTANVPTWLKLIKESNSFEIVPDRADIVKQIFQMSYDGQGIVTIARHLNKTKTPAFRSSKGWCQSTVRKILSSRSVIGEYQPHIYRKGMSKPEPVGDVVTDYFPAIIDKDIYNAVQARFANGTHVAGRTAKVQNLFGGITTCGYCGSRMDVVKKGNYPKEVHYLVCTSARKGVGCSYISIKCNEIEDAFLTFCREKELLDVLNLEGERDKERQKGLLHQISAKEGELISINKKLDILNEELLDTTDKSIRKHFKDQLTVFIHLKENLEQFITQLNREVTDINQSFEDVDTRIRNILDIVRDVNESASEEERITFRIKLRNSLRQIIKQVLVYPRGNLSSNQQIEISKLKFETELATVDGYNHDILRHERDTAINQLLDSQSNTIDDRYFEIHFKNGNLRRIGYLKNEGAFKDSFNRIGSTVEWASRGKQMKPIVLDEETRQIKEEVEQYIKAHPEKNMTPEDGEVMEEWFANLYNQQPSD